MSVDTAEVVCVRRLTFKHGFPSPSHHEIGANVIARLSLASAHWMRTRFYVRVAQANRSTAAQLGNALAQLHTVSLCQYQVLL